MDEDGFIELYRRYKHRLVRHALHILGDSYLAEDVAHDTLLKASKKLPPGMADPWPWLRRVAYNACIDMIRSREREVGQRLGKEIPQDSAQSIAERRADRIAVRDALRELPSPHKECLYMAYWEGRSYEEIAKRLGVSKASVRDRLHYSKRLLQLKLRGFRDQGFPALLGSWLSNPQIWLGRAARRAVGVALISTASVGLIAMVEPGRGPASRADETRGRSPTNVQDGEIKSTATHTGAAISHPGATRSEDGVTHAHSIGGVAIPAGPSANGPGSTDGQIGPITVHCDPGQTDPVTEILCAVLVE